LIRNLLVEHRVWLVGDDLRVDMRRLSPSQQETLRKWGMAAVRDGMSIAEAVRVFGVSRGSVRNWKARFDAGGAAGLDSGTPGRRAGEQTKLSASDAETSVGSIVDYVPDDLDLGGKLWTRRKVGVLAILTRGELDFTVLRDACNAEVFIAFLDRLLGQAEETIHLVVDGHWAHRATKVAAWVNQRSDRIEMHFLPAYAPHPNPDELVNADWKHTLADQAITDRGQMERAVRMRFHRAQHAATEEFLTAQS
jgi:transposase